MFEQNRVLVRLQQRVIREAAIKVCFLSGSYGTDTFDEYSDLDVTLVFSDDTHRDEAFSNRHEFVRSVLPYVPAKSFDADHIRPYFHIALYSNGAKVDYLYETQGTIKPGPWYSKIRLLKDSNDWGEQFVVDVAQHNIGTLPPTITADSLASIDNRFWIMLMDVFRQLQRGDYAKPFPVYLRLLSFTLPDILNLLPHDDPAYHGLIQVNYSEDTVATMDHLRLLLKAYTKARSSIIRRYQLIYTADKRFEEELIRIINRV